MVRLSARVRLFGAKHSLRKLEGYRKASEALVQFKDDPKWHAKMAEIAAEHPQIRELGTAQVVPEFLNLLLENEELAKALSQFDPKPGETLMPSTASKFVNVMQWVTLRWKILKCDSTAGFLP
jgi:hypothetical protein